jgi:type IV secretory pathway VirB2 component (pilin)
MTPSLFDAPQGSALSAATDWLAGLLAGPAAAALCVVAVAIVGITMLSGRLAIRDGARVILGCFILLGAPLLAAEFRGFADDAAGVAAAAEPSPAAQPLGRVGRELPPADYDPYAGASLRGDSETMGE